MAFETGNERTADEKKPGIYSWNQIKFVKTKTFCCRQTLEQMHTNKHTHARAPNTEKQQIHEWEWKSIWFSVRKYVHVLLYLYICGLFENIVEAHWNYIHLHARIHASRWLRRKASNDVLIHTHSHKHTVCTVYESTEACVSSVSAHTKRSEEKKLSENWKTEQQEHTVLHAIQQWQ